MSLGLREVVLNSGEFRRKRENYYNEKVMVLGVFLHFYAIFYWGGLNNNEEAININKFCIIFIKKKFFLKKINQKNLKKFTKFEFS